LLAFPIILLAVILVKSVFPDFILFFFTTPVHELGHAAVSWLGGRFAIPIGAIIPMAGFTLSFYSRSSIIYVFVAGLLGATGFYALKRELHFLLCLSIALLYLQFQLTWEMSPDQWQMWMVFGGIGGEFVLGALWALCFFHPMPARLRWDFFRFLFLPLGLLALCSAVVHWNAIYSHREEIPWGTFLSGGADSGGDMERLKAYGWSSDRIASSYHRLGLVCASAVILDYLCFAAHYFWRGARKP
jgi:hypothetical protein